MGARERMLLRASTGIFAAALLCLAAAPPASAQGLFERLFGFFRQHAPASAQAYADPFSSLFRGPRAPAQSDGGPASAYCVRESDGFYFPVQAHAGVSAAQACRAFCPASATRLYSGGGIDHAVAADGSRYADLPAAYLYRKQIVAGATCNGRDHFGLAHVDVATDPTLKPGDIVATRDGLVAVAGTGNNKTADFTPIDNDRSLPKSVRDKLAGVKIMPTARGASAPVSMGAYAGGGDDNRSAQLSR